MSRLELELGVGVAPVPSDMLQVALPLDHHPTGAGPVGHSQTAVGPTVG